MHYHGLRESAGQQEHRRQRILKETLLVEKRLNIDLTDLFGCRFTYFQDRQCRDQWQQTTKEDLRLHIRRHPDLALQFILNVSGTDGQRIAAHAGTFASILWTIADESDRWNRYNSRQTAGKEIE